MFELSVLSSSRLLACLALWIEPIIMSLMPNAFRRASSRALLILVVAAIATPRLAADTYPRQPGIKIAGYTFDITLSDANDEFVVVETVDVQFVAAGVTAIELDLCKFSAQPRSGKLDNGFADPCAEPVGGRGGAAAPPKGGKGMTVTGAFIAT